MGIIQESFLDFLFQKELAMRKLAAVVCALAVVMLVGCTCNPPEQPQPMPYKGETMAK